MWFISVEYTKELDDWIKNFIKSAWINLYWFLNTLWFEQTAIYKWRLRKRISIWSYNIIAKHLWLSLIWTLYDSKEKKGRKLQQKWNFFKIGKLLKKERKHKKKR